MKKTKIVCTIGPASWKAETLKQMVDAGMNVARINASFADEAELERVSTAVWGTSPDVAVMLDTKGHKIRISDFGEPIQLNDGEEFVLGTEPNKSKVYSTYADLEKDVSAGSQILLDDGKIELKVKEIKGEDIICDVVQGGLLKRGKTINVPGTHLNFPPLTEKDFHDIEFAVKHKFDFIAASFVRNLEDVKAIKKLTEGSRTKLIAKIEDPEGASNFDSILNEVDGIMVARGDLGVEIPAAKVPILQKEFIKKCNALGKPVIVATHMLESMVDNARPTRAEVNDVANAIYDGTDAVMLSAETSTGKFPVKAVETMARIAEEVEKGIPMQIVKEVPISKPTTNAIGRAVIEICETLPIDKILVVTRTGTTARVISRHKPPQNIFSFVRDEIYKRQLALSRGITAEIISQAAQTRDAGIQEIAKLAKEKGFVTGSDFVIIVAGANVIGQEQTNMIEVNRVADIVK